MVAGDRVCAAGLSRVGALRADQFDAWAVITGGLREIEWVIRRRKLLTIRVSSGLRLLAMPDRRT